jgi:hypothetical protein
MYPGGIEIPPGPPADQIRDTEKLLERADVTIYEAAIEADGLFARVDILRMQGTTLDLVEVKAKSFHPDTSGNLRGARGAISPEYRAYVRDVAFQRYVLGLRFPGHTVRSFLLMPDTSRCASVDGLNQRFRVRRSARGIDVALSPGTDSTTIGDPVLTAVPVDDLVDEVLGGTLPVEGVERPFRDAVKAFAAARRGERRLEPIPGSMCASCEFRTASPPGDAGPRSGFHECWSAAFGWGPRDFEAGTVLDLWNFRGKADLIQRRVLKLTDVRAEDIGFDVDGGDPNDDGLSVKRRQWFQVSRGWPGGGPFHVDRPRLRQAMAQWRYPLHFIDFETCAVAIPFTKGHRPYETVAFQFSHHVLHADGRVEHRSQHLDATPGRGPNLGFLRALRSALETDAGTVFRWAAHENTVLGQLRRQLLEDPAPPADRDRLVEFIDTLTSRTGGKATIAGSRCMVDLCRIAERYFFHPHNGGSSSLKKVLPALFESSGFLRETYGQPVYGTARMPSLNFTVPVTWWQQQEGRVLDSYDLLPPVFPDVGRAEQDALDAGLASTLQEGGAAMAAYARLQFEDLDGAQRAAIEQALLRYCELDTLAMVMAAQAWGEWAREAGGTP